MKFYLQSSVHGYHEYGEHWTAFLGEHLTCQHRVDNVTDRYAAVTVKI